MLSYELNMSQVHESALIVTHVLSEWLFNEGHVEATPGPNSSKNYKCLLQKGLGFKTDRITRSAFSFFSTKIRSMLSAVQCTSNCTRGKCI
jgi:hypothetical protein